MIETFFWALAILAYAYVAARVITRAVLRTINTYEIEGVSNGKRPEEEVTQA